VDSSPLRDFSFFFLKHQNGSQSFIISISRSNFDKIVHLFKVKKLEIKLDKEDKDIGFR